MMLSVELEPIWHEEVQQQIFRSLLSCSSLPGTIADLSQVLHQQSALMGVLATLLDHSVTLYDRDALISQHEQRMLGAPPAPLSEARFIVAKAGIPPEPEFQPNLGTLPSPEFGATLILVGDSLGEGSLMLTLTGPGIPGQRCIFLTGFNSDWFYRRKEWVALFPMGVDLILLDKTKVLFLPRTTQVEIGS